MQGLTMALDSMCAWAPVAALMLRRQWTRWRWKTTGPRLLAQNLATFMRFFWQNVAIYALFRKISPFMQFFGKMSRFTHFFLGSAQTVKITLSSAFKFLSALAPIAHYPSVESATVPRILCEDIWTAVQYIARNESVCLTLVDFH